MKKNFRLLKNRCFQKVLYKKKQFISNTLILYYIPNNLNHIRIGVSVSKKFGNAVVRNSTRRKSKAILATLDITSLPYDVVLIVRNNFIKISFEKKQKELDLMFERLKNEQNTIKKSSKK
jgi:ribonuclease P protein component